MRWDHLFYTSYWWFIGFSLFFPIWLEVYQLYWSFQKSSFNFCLFVLFHFLYGFSAFDFMDFFLVSIIFLPSADLCILIFSFWPLKDAWIFNLKPLLVFHTHFQYCQSPSKPGTSTPHRCTMAYLTLFLFNMFLRSFDICPSSHGLFKIPLVNFQVFGDVLDTILLLACSFNSIIV